MSAGVSPIARQPELVPHPPEIVPGHRSGISPHRAGFEEQQPRPHQFPARCGLHRLAWGLALERRDGLVEAVAVVAVHLRTTFDVPTALVTKISGLVDQVVTWLYEGIQVILEVGPVHTDVVHIDPACELVP